MSRLRRCFCFCCSRKPSRPPKLPPYSVFYFRRRPWSRTTGPCNDVQILIDQLFLSSVDVATEDPVLNTRRAKLLGSRKKLLEKRLRRKLTNREVIEKEKNRFDFHWDFRSRLHQFRSSGILRVIKSVHSRGTDLDQILMEFDAIEEAKLQKINKHSNPNTRVPMEGLILKFTNVVKGYQYRWFVLNPESGTLEYFEKEEHKKLKPRGSIHLAAAVVSPSEEDSQTFIISAASGELFKLRAADAKERQLWVDRIRSTAEYHTANMAQGQTALVQKSQSLATDQLSILSVSPTQKGSIVTQHSTHKDSFKKSKGSHENLHYIKKVSRDETLTEVKDYLLEAEDYARHLEDKILALPVSGHYINSLDSDILMLKATAAATLQCIQDCINILYTAELPVRSTVQTLDEQVVNKSAILRLSGGVMDDSEPLPDPEEEVLDEVVEKDTELEGMEEHKSVILHLLSQLKLGMDLTKVVLPTFILEKRSLLEMFADYMCHPDLFLKIPEITEPDKRMLAVLEWYLSSFHVGKQGSVAKKPYNPIIGETFHCSWRLRGSDEKQQTIIYTGEQVSHHPPISAFYFGSPDGKVKMNASIYTKSKFMGMSIGVSMIGKVKLSFEELKEDYIFGMPSAYARSILSVPWMELGDKVTIVCEKTGYQASIVFHTKPFYGGKLHHITAEAKNIKTGEVICKAQGEWNNVMELTYPNGSTKTLDVNLLDVHRKYVRPVEKQKEYESRKLWLHVTKALSLGDINTATEHKKILEEIQREGEKHRRDLNIKYSAKYFKNVDGIWLFKALPDDFASDIKKLSAT
ncbi:oxysterol-binding protein-related protein 11-like isoform X1 [Biomphalaria glabrata]|uniref:Oxysterol-binding protein n=2 Tax=Biomphalaria glabrata TaxID=6526 RepID=A0A9U8ELK2_BIOGL|nr:oxysterol-binding protein-related protein 11-like isoform X1 [Biomphalaria glabrata]